MRITIKDIAFNAGVSKTTVSFAFNDPSKISRQTHEKIMRIAEELGYVPDPVARSLTKKRIGTIGFLLPQPINEALKNPYLFEILQGIGAICHERDFSLTIIPPARGCITDAVRRAAVDAFLTVGVGPDTRIAGLLERRKIPFVTIDGEPSESAPNIGIDDEAAAYSILEHVLSLGHRRIAIIELKTAILNLPGERFSRVIDMRMAGYRRALGEKSLSIGDGSVFLFAAESSIEGGSETARAIFDESDKPTVCVCMSDIIALGVYSACRERGIRIPEDMSVAGFDDIPMARLLSPPLTTVRQPGFEKGHKAARLVVDLLEGKAEGLHLMLDTRLMTRSSVAWVEGASSVPGKVEPPPGKAP